MSLTIETMETPEATIVAVTGEVDVSNANELADVLEGLVTAGTKAIDVNMAHVPYIDSTGIGVLVGAAHKVSESGGEMTLSKPQPNVLRVLTLLGVGTEFHVHDDAGSASDD